MTAKFRREYLKWPDRCLAAWSAPPSTSSCDLVLVRTRLTMRWPRERARARDTIAVPSRYYQVTIFNHSPLDGCFDSRGHRALPGKPRASSFQRRKRNPTAWSRGRRRARLDVLELLNSIDGYGGCACTGGIYLFYGAPLQHADRAVFYAYFLFTHSGLPSQGVVVFTLICIYVAKS